MLHSDPGHNCHDFSCQEVSSADVLCAIDWTGAKALKSLPECLRDKRFVYMNFRVYSCPDVLGTLDGRNRWNQKLGSLGGMGDPLHSFCCSLCCVPHIATFFRWLSVLLFLVFPSHSYTTYPHLWGVIRVCILIFPLFCGYVPLISLNINSIR